MTPELTPKVLAAAERLNSSADEWRYMEDSHVPGDIQAVCRFIASHQQQAAERGKSIDEEWPRILEGEADDSSLTALRGLVDAIDDDPNVLRLSRSSVAALVAARDLLKALKIQAKGSE